MGYFSSLFLAIFSIISLVFFISSKSQLAPEKALNLSICFVDMRLFLGCSVGFLLLF